MLNIYFGTIPEAIYNTAVFFKNTYKDSWITDPLAAEIIKDVDQSKVIGSNVIESPVLGMITPLLLLNPGYALAALLHGQTGILSSVMAYHDSGRLLCAFRLMDRAGGETVALVSCGAVAVLGMLLLVLAAFVLRRTAMKSGGGK